ncbi:hypothetical protein I7I51_04533 [Histoplasma capsulatum]|uniref:Chromo domain-containing protein n=1 Tax=Ajellomyces capsulatus TaxID=5037 RepID=A0A8A1M9B7_AJECA|nr:hypothetical protein I7I51_04533 [Histoplasma capsulatum]
MLGSIHKTQESLSRTLGTLPKEERFWLSLYKSVGFSLLKSTARRTRITASPNLYLKSTHARAEQNPTAVTMDKIRFYQPPNPMNPSKLLQSPKLPAIPRQLQLPNPSAQRPIPSADTSSSLSCPSQQLRHPLPPRPSPFVSSPISSPSASQRSQSPETPGNDFDRILEEISSDDGSQPLCRSQRNTNDHAATFPSRSDLSDSSDDRFDITIKVDAAEESVPEARLHAYRSGASRDDPIVIDDSMEICHDDGFTEESVDAQTPRPLSSEKGGELDPMADGSAALTPREVSETPPLTVSESTSSRDAHTRVSPRPQSRSPPIPVERATKEEWPVRRILDSRIRVRGDEAMLEYLVAWKTTWRTRQVRQLRFRHIELPAIPAVCNGTREGWPVRKILHSRIRVRGDEESLEDHVSWESTWQPRSDLIPGCKKLVREFHAEWKNKRPSLTTLAGYRHFKQRQRSRRAVDARL